MGADGKTFGLFSYGVIATTCQVIQHHIQVAVNVRNWGVIYSLIFIFAISQLPLTMWCAQLFTRSQVHMAITNELWGSPVNALIVLFVVGTISLPFLGARVYRNCYKEPELYAVEEIDDPCWKGVCGEDFQLASDDETDGDDYFKSRRKSSKQKQKKKQNLLN